MTRQVTWQRARWFVGSRLGQHTVFASLFTPTEDSHGAKYSYCTGPFATKRAAQDYAALMTNRANAGG